MSPVNLLHVFHDIGDVLDGNEWETSIEPLLWRHMLEKIEAIVDRTLHALVVEEDAEIARLRAAGEAVRDAR